MKLLKNVNIKTVASISMVIMVLALFNALRLWEDHNNFTQYVSVFYTIVCIFFGMMLYIFARPKENRCKLSLHLFSAAMFLLVVIMALTELGTAHNEFGGSAIAAWVILYIIMISYLVIDLCFWYSLGLTLKRNSKYRKHTSAIHIILALYVVGLIVNIFTHTFCYIDAAGKLQFNNIGSYCDLGIWIVYFAIYLYTVVTAKELSAKRKLAISSYVTFPAFWNVIRLISFVSGRDMIVDIAAYPFYLLASYVIYFNIIVEDRGKLAEARQKETELKSDIMISQIQPHFLYNALTAIRGLCKENPQQAYDEIGNFAEYLRANMDGLTQKNPIPFPKELEHTKTYLSLEKMRFADDLNIVYNIQYDDFYVPPLALQPMVENAVRHGALMNENGGTVTINTKKTDTGAIIQIIDDGPGFDVQAVPDSDRSHVGIENVRKRLMYSGIGSMVIDSAPGKGTTVTIDIIDKD